MKKTKLMIMVMILMINNLILPIKAQTIANYYPKIKMKVPVIKQEPQGCAIASMASVEAYFMHEQGQDYSTSKLYQMIKRTNNAGVLAYWSRIGYVQMDFNDEKSYLNYMYNELASGYPVIVYRNSPHYSVVYGYNGNKDQLTLSGFMVADVAQGVKTYTNLKDWIGEYQTNYHLIVRKDGYRNASNFIKKVEFAISHPSKMMQKGKSEEVKGTITSPINLKEIKAGIYDKNDHKVYEIKQTIDTKCYVMSQLDNSLLFSKLDKGEYCYRIIVSDDFKKQSKFEYYFRVVDSIEHPIASYSQFFDIRVSSWYYQVVEEIIALGYMSGFNEHYFGADEYFTRGMAAVVLYNMSSNMSNEHVEYQKIFDDVSDNQYYSQAVTWCYQNKVISGYGDGLFHPDEYITREQLVVMLRNYHQKKQNANGRSLMIMNQFSDVKAISDYATSAMTWAVSNNIINGNAQKCLEPKRYATRSEAAKLFLLLDKLK